MDSAFGYLIIVVMTIIVIFAFVLRRVFAVGAKITSIEDYLFAHSAESKGLEKNTTVLTAIASNFQTANALFVGMWFGFNFGLAIAVLSLLFAGGIWLLYRLLARLDQGAQSVVLENTTLPYERIFGARNRGFANIVSLFVYVSIVFGAVTEVWFGSRMASDAIAPMISTTDGSAVMSSQIAIAVVASLISAFLFFYVYFGGYRAVAETDRIQTASIGVMLVILLIGVVLNVVSNLDLWEWKRFILGAGNSYDDLHFVFALLCGAAVLNIFWQLVLPTQWQRAAAAESASTYVSSLPIAALGTVVTWSAPVLIGAIAAAAEGSNIGGVPTPFQGWHDLSVVVPISAGIAKIVAAIAIGVAVAGIFSAALSTADTSIIIVVTKLIQYQRAEQKDLKEVRGQSIAIVIVVCLLAGVLYYFNPPIDKFIFAVSTAQILFAAFFWRYIVSGGIYRIEDSGSALRVTIAFAASFVLAFAFNLVPYFANLVPNIGFWFPVVVLGGGYLLCQRTNSGTNQGSQLSRKP